MKRRVNRLARKTGRGSEGLHHGHKVAVNQALAVGLAGKDSRVRPVLGGCNSLETVGNLGFPWIP